MGFSALLKTAFPFISAAASLGGPVGAIAAQAVGKALGVDKVEPTEEGISTAITTAITGNAEAMNQLKQAEQQFQLQMTELGFDEVEKLEALADQDTANARAREIAVKDWTPTILAYALVGGFIGMAYFVLFHKMSADSALAGAVIGYLSAKAEQVVTYYFGSSAGSAQKTAILAAQGVKP